MSQQVLEIDDALMRRAVESVGSEDPSAVVEQALRSMLDQAEAGKLRVEVANRRLLEMEGTLPWTGNLDEMRQNRFSHER